MNGEIYSYEVAIENTTDEDLIIKGYKTKDGIGTQLPIPELTSVIYVFSHSLSETKIISIPTPLGSPAFGFIYPGFETRVDSITLQWANTEKGYYSNDNNTEFWLENKSSLLNIEEKDIIFIDDILIYRITQEDYENAHNLE